MPIGSGLYIGFVHAEIGADGDGEEDRRRRGEEGEEGEEERKTEGGAVWGEEERSRKQRRMCIGKRSGKRRRIYIGKRSRNLSKLNYPPKNRPKIRIAAKKKIFFYVKYTMQMYIY